MAEVAKAYVTIIPSMQGSQGTIAKELGAEVDSAGKSAGSKFGSAVATGVKVAGAAVAAATGAVAAFGKSAVNAGMDFDSSMSQVAATMGVSVDQIGNLRDFAQEMGRTTAFSATEAADALNYMALAGYDADTSMQMLPNVLNLAAAGNMDLASASDMVTDAQSALGLSLGETSKMVDQMAVTSSKTNTSVSQLGEAILTVGGTAQFMANGTDELNMVLGVLADNGIKGAEGGTHLRNMLLKLSDPTDKGAAALEELGVSIFDAEGNMRSFTDIFPDLNAAMSELTDEEKITALGEIFNSRDIASAQALLGTSVDRWNELSAAIGTADGAAQKMADTQLDNLAGDITLFQSALEGAKITVSDQLSPTLREFVQMGTDGLSQVTAAFQEGGLEGAMSAFGDVLANAVNLIIENAPKMIEGAIALLEALGQGISDNIGMIAEAAINITMQFATFILDNLPLLIETALSIVITLAQGIGEALPELIPAVIDTLLMIGSIILDNLPLLLDAALSIIMGLVTGITDNVDKITDGVIALVMGITDFFIDNIDKIIVLGIRVVLAMVEGLIQAVPRLLGGIIQLIGHIRDKWLNYDWAGLGKSIIDGLVAGVKNFGSKFIEAIKELAKDAWQGIKDFFQIKSPSHLMAYAGEMIDEGLAGGVDKKKDVPVRALEDVGASMTESFSFSAAETFTVNEEETDDRGLLEEIRDLLASQKLVLDSGAVVGGLIGHIDRAMNQRYEAALRGV